MLSTRAIRGWTSGERPWFYLGEELGAAQAELVGARPSEVVVSGGITVNLHALLATFFRPSGLESIVESGDYQSYAEDRTSAA